MVGNFSCTTSYEDIYKIGCKEAFGNFIRDHAYTLGGVGLGFAIIQVSTYIKFNFKCIFIIAIIFQFLGIIFACHLSKQIKYYDNF